MWTRFFTTALCLVAFGSELVLDGSTAFVRAQTHDRVGKLVISSTNPIENEDLPPTDSHDTPDWAKSQAPSHASGLAQAVAFDFQVFILVHTLFTLPDYQEPHTPVSHRPPIFQA
jgi:hypothetical protein